MSSSKAHLSSLCRRLRLVDGELQASQGYTAGPCLKIVLKPVSEAGEEGRNTEGQNQVCLHHHFCPAVKGCLAQSGARSLLAEPSLGTHCSFGPSPMWSFTNEAAREPVAYCFACLVSLWDTNLLASASCPPLAGGLRESRSASLYPAWSPWAVYPVPSF